MAKPTTAEIAAAPKIKLGDREFSIPALAPRQNRIITPLAMKFGLFAKQTDISEEVFDSLIAVIHTAITRAYPDVTRDDILDTAMSMQEMLDAVVTIYEQTGVLQRTPADGGAPAGEVGADRSTGTS